MSWIRPQDMPLDKPLVLVGMPGSGKSTLGPVLAGRMGLLFTDLDRKIELDTGCSVSKFFEHYGEQEFRCQEHAVLLELVGKPGIIAAGGGTQVYKPARELLQEKTTTAWLRAGIDTLVQRTAHSDHRPLLTGDDRKEQLQKLLEQREAWYKGANITIDTDLPSKNLNRQILQLEREISALKSRLSERLTTNIDVAWLAGRGSLDEDVVEALVSSGKRFYKLRDKLLRNEALLHMLEALQKLAEQPPVICPPTSFP